MGRTLGSRVSIAATSPDRPHAPACVMVFCPLDLRERESALPHVSRGRALEQWLQARFRGHEALHRNTSRENSELHTVRSAAAEPLGAALLPRIPRTRARLRPGPGRPRSQREVPARLEALSGEGEGRHRNLALLQVKKVQKRKTGVAVLCSPVESTAGGVPKHEHLPVRDATPEGMMLTAPTHSVKGVREITAPRPPPPGRPSGRGTAPPGGRTPRGTPPGPRRGPPAPGRSPAAG